ncbi:MAG: type II secretion system F family protein [Thaumarchaeota archaeon]|nr:type II secretion system F family protein [Nitrososphaerota archaeon]
MASCLAALVVLPISAFLGSAVSPYFFALGALPAVVLFLPELRLRDSCSKRKEGVERALPFFSILVNVMAGAGMPLYSIFEEVSKTDFFEAVRKEALWVRRDVTVFGMDPNRAFERLAASHPSNKFATFLFGYTSKVRSGGDMVVYLTGQSASMIRELEEGWSRYSDRAGIVGSLMVTVFGVLPLLLLVVSIFSPAASMVGLLVFTGVAVPLFTLALITMAGRMQPSGEVVLRGRAARGLLAGTAGVAVGYLAGSAWVGAALAISGFFVVHGLSVREALRENREVEAALPEFMKDVLELKRQEYGLAKGLMNMAEKNRYNASFDRMLLGIASQLRAGTPLEDVRVSSRSTLARMTFFLLGKMAHTGGGTVDTVFQMSLHTGAVVEARRKARVEMRPYLVLSYVSPLMLAFGVTFVRGVLSSFGKSFSPGSSASVSPLQIGIIPPALGQVSDLLIVVSAAALGLIGVKMTEFTVRDTLRASGNLFLAVGAIIVLSGPTVGFLFPTG